MNIIFSDHARIEMQRRNIEEETVLQVIQDYDSSHELRPGRKVLHKTLIAPDMKKALLYRVFIDTDRTPAVVVTVYRTSKIAKYEVFQ